MQQYLTRQQSIDWFKEHRTLAVKQIADQGGKIKLKCPLCEAMGEFTVVPDFDNSDSKYKVSFYCAECGFRIDDTGLKSFPPPSPPKHFRKRKHKKNKISPVEIAGTLLLTISACVLYGIIHDQFTTRICIEYFTIAHPTIIESQSPTMLAFAWGLVATWWVGLYLAIPLYFTSFRGPWLKRTLRSLIKPVMILMLICGISATIAGLIGYWLAETGRIHLDELWSQAIPQHQHSKFFAVWFAHNASYYTGFAGGVVIMVIILIQRIRLKKLSKND